MSDKDLLIREAREIQHNIDEALREWANTKGDPDEERKIRSRVQLLMCATMQELDCIISFIEKGGF
jgi:hypothetical protein